MTLLEDITRWGGETDIPEQIPATEELEKGVWR